MTPVIKRLQSKLPDLPIPDRAQSLVWNFDQQIKIMDADFYRQVVAMHPILNIEYSILCTQLRHSFSFPDQIKKDVLVDQIISALILAELLELVHLHYLNVPREVSRLRRQQAIYRNLLVELEVYNFSPRGEKAIEVGLSLSQQIRDTTLATNWYRLLFIRSKRALDFIDMVGTGSASYKKFVLVLDQYANPFLAYFAWCFYIPRLSTNLFLILKHTIPGPWMKDEEHILGWIVRFQAQLNRRWFEVMNDSVWFGVGLVNCFLLVGSLSPVGMYLAIFFYVFDVANAALRAYIELNRLFELYITYTTMQQHELNPDERKIIADYQVCLANRINFEKLRLGLTVGNTIAILIAMGFAAPVFAINPVIPLIGAVLLVLICIISFTLTRMVENYRPKDNLEPPTNLEKMGFFARQDTSIPPSPELIDAPGAS